MHRLASVAWAFASVALAFVFGLAGCAHYEVTRIYGGRVRAERFIDEVAYREFLVGAELEERGEWSAAAAAYRRALSDDPESVEAWVRVGAVACRMGADPSVSFAEAERLDASFAPLWRGRADCARALGRPVHEATSRAFLLDPEDEETALEHARSLVESGAIVRARWLLRELAVRHPASLTVWRAILARAVATGDLAWQHAAEARLSELDPRRAPVASDAIAAIEAALVAGDSARAAALAQAGRLGAAGFVGLAIVVGDPALAVTVAERVLAADPDATDVRLLGALAADLARDAARRDRWVTGVGRLHADEVGELGRVALAELVLRHGGETLPESMPMPTSNARAALDAAVARRLRLRGHAPLVTR